MLLEMNRPILQAQGLQPVESSTTFKITAPSETVIKSVKQPPVRDYSGEQSYNTTKNAPKRQPLNSDEIETLDSIKKGSSVVLDPKDSEQRKREVPVCGCTKKKKMIVLTGVLLAGVVIGKSI